MKLNKWRLTICEYERNCKSSRKDVWIVGGSSSSSSGEIWKPLFMMAAFYNVTVHQTGSQPLSVGCVLLYLCWTILVIVLLLNNLIYVLTCNCEGAFPFKMFSALYILLTFFSLFSFPSSSNSGMLDVKKFLYPSCSARLMLSMVGISFRLNISSLLVLLCILISANSSVSALLLTDVSFWPTSGSFWRSLSEIKRYNEIFEKNEI